MSSADVTVVIPARNAAATIGRAVASVRGGRLREIVLVDHACGDDTVAVAQRHAPCALRVVPADASLRLGGVRQCGVEAVTTPLAIWLDADDEFLDGRVDRLAARLDAGADLVADAAEVQTVDGARRVVPIPAFVQRPGGWVRLFERNYLPAPGVIGFRTDVLRRVSYDPAQHGPEDTDVLLRALDSGARLMLEPTPGYRIHALPTSLSRDMRNQRAMYRALLLKHAPDHVQALYLANGWSRRVALWALHTIALFVDDLPAAASHLDAISALADNVADDEIVEPDGPQPYAEGWRLAFARGTLALLAGNDGLALEALTDAERRRPSAEGANNLGIALVRLGRPADAAACFTSAVKRRPDYVDARANLADPAPTRVTTHPFRAHDNRLDYTLPAAVHA
jgi:glycosyltransferase involved in cell wall biosynthesis